MAEPWDSLLALFPDNDQGLITAATMRTQVEALELVDSENVKGQSDQVIIKNQDDTLDIADTVVSILDATSTKRYVITLNSGEYTTKPVTMKPYVYIQGEPGVVINPSTVNDTMFTMTSNSELTNVTLNGATSGIGASFTTSGDTKLNSIVFKDCHTGIYVDTTGTLEAHGSTYSGTMTYGANATGGEITMWHPEVTSGSTIETFLSFSDTILSTVSNALCTASGVTNAIVCSGTAAVLLNNPGVLGASIALTVTGDTNVTVKGGEFFQCGVGAYLPVDLGNTIVEFSGTTASESTTYDYQLENPNASVTGLGAGDLSKSILVEGMEAVGLMVDKTEGDEGCQIFGELKVGTALLPSESCFGEGDSYASEITAGMYTWDGASWADVTADLASPSGSPLIWPGTAVDTAIYIASMIEKDGDYLKIPGFKYSLTQIATSASGDNPFVVEYFDGGTWLEVHSMTSLASGTYQSQAEDIFEKVGSFQTRLDANLPAKTWGPNDPMSLGTSYYWIRIRCTETLTQAPILEQIKLHSNRTEINADGYLEFFGKARPFRGLPWDSGLLTATGNNPSGTHLYVSDNVDRLLIGNLLPNGTSESVGFNTYLPNGIDTSTPITMRMAIVSTAASATTASFVVRWAWTNDGDSVYDNAADAPVTGPNEQSVTVDVLMPATADTQTSFTTSLDISQLVPARETDAGDMLWITIERPTGDAHGGDISVINLSAEYVTYSLGGHI